jgi:hypothetical protein
MTGLKPVLQQAGYAEPEAGASVQPALNGGISAVFRGKSAFSWPAFAAILSAPGKTSWADRR